MALATGHQSYDPTFFELLFEVEDKHFWFRSRNQVIAALVKRLIADLTKAPRILEVGCGTGNVLRVLDEACPYGAVIGLDLFAEGLTFARKRTSVALVQGDLHRPPFIDQFDFIGLFDVLEHLSDDRQVLSDLHSMLRVNGALLLTVPAHPQLWSYFDEASHHSRRYQADELKAKLIEAGYDVEYFSQYMMSILPLMWIGRRLSGLRGRALQPHNNALSDGLAMQELRPIPVLNAVLVQLMHLEERWLACGRILPLGASLLVVARRRA